MSDEQREMTLEEWVNRLPEIHLAHRQYKELLEDQNRLRALEAAGVDNWDGYDYALDQLKD